LVLLLLMLSRLFRQTKKLTMSIKGDSNKESEEPDYDEDKEQLEEEQEKETRELETANETF
jgi:hypothetical protein